MDIEKRIELAKAGDKESLECLLTEIQDTVFNLSLRMLGTVVDAEDASQEILVKVMTHLSTFRGESAFLTWVYRLATNYLLNYKKSMFSAHPLDFEFYGNDIRYAKTDETDVLIEELDRQALSEELKLSCTNVMLQCLDPESRCIFILGTMFKMESSVAASALHITAEAYRQRLFRVRKKMAEFLAEYCGLSGTGFCSCKKRVEYAISQRRLDPKRLEFTKLHPLDTALLQECKDEMEKLDELALSFESLPHYKATVNAGALLEKLLKSNQLKNIQAYERT